MKHFLCHTFSARLLFVAAVYRVCGGYSLLLWYLQYL